MPKSRKTNTRTADPLNLPALKKRYDELKAQQLGVFQSMDALPGAEIVALEDLLIAKKVLPAKPKAREIYDGLQKQNQALTAELAQVRAKLAEHEGKEKRLDLVRRLIAMDDDDVRLVRAGLDSIEHFHGCNTPAEEFVRDMLHDYSRGPLTPQDVERSLEHFREDYNDMVADAKAFLAMHPDFAKETAGAA